MKFGKRLKQQIEETLPEWQDKFLSYKDLKKLVRLISFADSPSSRLAAEGHFLRCLDAEIDKFNSFFVEKEEEFIIRQKLLKERIQIAVDGGEIGRIQKDIVNFHGEMVLLENYSSINYTGGGRMKFGKRLKQQIEETLPEWQDKFLSYKDLKKLVRLVSSRLAAEGHFLRCLDAEIDKFNSFFVEQEEDFIIRQKMLKERIQIAVDGGEMGRIQKDIVNFHGEMVLLENYSSINYTGLGKILKKYDKQTGGLLRIPFIEKVLKQPFFTIEILTKLVKDCELMMETVFIPRPREERGAITATTGSGIFRNAVIALETMHELRKGSSTYSHFSLPPLNLPDTDLLQSFKFSSPIPIQ